MVVGRVSEIRLIAPVSPPKGRISEIRLTGTAVAGSRGRVSTIRLIGNPPVGSKGRVSAVRLLGSVAMLLAPFVARTVEPLAMVDVTAVLSQGVATGFEWRVVSAPAGVTVTLSGTGAARRFRAPGLRAGGVVVLGVLARNGTAASPEQLVTITVLPQITWVRYPGGAWQPGKFIL